MFGIWKVRVFSLVSLAFFVEQEVRSFVKRDGEF